MMKDEASEQESRKNFLDFVEAARKDTGRTLENEFNAVLRKNSAEKLLEFFEKMQFRDISPDDCEAIIRIAQGGPVDFQVQPKY
jgi:pentatricopeptide repeat protein